MTRKELSQLYHLNREIEHDRRRLAELKSAATSTTSKITGLPHFGGVTDKTAIMAEAADLEALIQNKIERSMIEYKRLVRYIDSVDDSLVRQILLHRFVDGLSWTAVAMRVGNDNTADGVRMIANRYIHKN